LGKNNPEVTPIIFENKPAGVFSVLPGFKQTELFDPARSPENPLKIPDRNPFFFPDQAQKRENFF